MSKQGIASKRLAQHHKLLMRDGRPEAHETARLLVDLAGLKKCATPVKVKKGLAGFFTPSPRPYAELIEGGRAMTISEFMEVADGDTQS